MENVVCFKLLGKQETLRTNISNERIQAIADIVNKKIGEIAAKRSVEPSTALGMVAALEIAADLYQLRQDYARLLSLADEPK